MAKRSINSELLRGRLRRLLDVSYPLDFAYYLVYPGKIVPISAAAVFRAWVLGEAAAMTKAFLVDGDVVGLAAGSIETVSNSRVRVI